MRNFNICIIFVFTANNVKYCVLNTQITKFYGNCVLYWLELLKLDGVKYGNHSYCGGNGNFFFKLPFNIYDFTALLNINICKNLYDFSTVHLLKFEQFNFK